MRISYSGLKSTNNSYFLFSVISVFLFLSCTKQAQERNKIQVVGEVEFPTGQGVISFGQIAAGDEVINSRTIDLVENKYFSFDVEVSTPDYYVLNFYDRQIIYLILSDSDIYIKAHGADPLGPARIQGSKEHDILTRYRVMIDSLEGQQEYIALKDSIRENAIRKNVDMLDSLNRAKRNWIFNTRNQPLLTYAKKQDLTLAHLQMLSVLHDSASVEYRKDTFRKLSEMYPSSKAVGAALKEFDLQREELNAPLD